ncbi:hypothetical protein [Chengkuizengella axinellae]|uniref:SPOR domain-containing protein n=1 Tax=Chengkuizengella axinellae TaxID=3064388 RepID=A0ABT9ITV1_9BACL|nr:hypothetical protein [Chengkuizengella sp. 2205SS18-9]MDP5272722.1 hypothetical protein [Chengkuizengella sp. 2205SS18-9]
MDKARLTYRFDKKDHKLNKKSDEDKKEIISLHEDEFTVVEEPDKTVKKEPLSEPILDSQPLNQFTTDYGAWSSPFDAETAKLEQLIRETDSYQNTGYNKRNRSQDDNQRDSYHDSQTEYSSLNQQDLYQQPYDKNSFDQNAYDQNAFDQNSYQQSSYGNRNPYGYVKKPRRPWFKIISSFTGAVIVGIAFGFFVLSFFSDSQETASTKDDNQTEIQSNLTESDEVLNESDQTTTPQPVLNLDGTLQLNLPKQTYFMLQNGMFENKEGAQEAIRLLDTNGYAAVSELNENFFVFAGMTTNRDDALLLSYKLQQDNLEVYVKSYEIPSIQQIKWNGNEAEAVQSYFSQGSELVEIISNLTLTHLKDQTFTTFENNSLETIKNMHQTWIGITPEINAGFPEEVKSNFEKMNSALTTAMISLEEYQKNPSSSLLWQTQTALMQYTIYTKDLLQKISV